MNTISLNQPDPDSSVLTIAGEITIEDARRLYEALLLAVGNGRTLSVDATALTRIDVAALQVLLAASRAAGGIHLANTSPAWSAACHRYGLEAFFQPQPA